MKKTGIIIAVVSSLFFFSCSSEANKKDVCDCEDLYQKMNEQQSTYTLVDKMSSDDAKAKVMSENKEAFDKCKKLHDDLGEDGYFKLSKECGSK